MVLIYAVVTAYVLAVNLYCVILVRSQKKLVANGKTPKKRTSAKILLSAVLGGAIATYVTMFAVRYKLDNMLLMLALPVIAVLNVFLLFTLFRFAPTFITV